MIYHKNKFLAHGARELIRLFKEGGEQAERGSAGPDGEKIPGLRGQSFQALHVGDGDGPAGEGDESLPARNI